MITPETPLKVKMTVTRDLKKPFAIAPSYNRMLCELFKAFEKGVAAAGS